MTAISMEAPGLVSSRQTTGRLELALASRRESCEAARLEVDRFLAPWEPGAQALFAIELVLEEVLMNIVWHAHAQADDTTIGLAVEVRADAFELRFEDQGAPFDPTEAPPPSVPATLDEARPGGLGIALVRKFARSLAYERAGRYNRLTITIDR
ncbi:MAG TPA: ATP-binding protein [Ramlibacter sp.]|nr:ATP-binding protein [Ramlibacter sp.]